MAEEPRKQTSRTERQAEMKRQQELDKQRAEQALRKASQKLIEADTRYEQPK